MLPLLFLNIGITTNMAGLDPIKHLQATLFSEAIKANGIKDFEEDATNIAQVMAKRFADPDRYDSGWDKVLNQGQFSGINSPEYQKVISGKLTEDEQRYSNKARQIAFMVGSGKIVAGDADHYVALDYKNEDRNHFSNLYPETHKTKGHRFMNEETWDRKKF